MSGLDPELVKGVSLKLIQNTERSFLEDTEETARTHKRKWKSYRLCPVCGKEIGNFGGNFKNHFKKCCPPVFECIESINHSYFGTYEGCLAQGLVSGDGRWTVPPLDLNEDETLGPTWRHLVNSSPFNGGGTPRRRDDRRSRRRNQYTECPSCRQPISAQTNYLTHLQMCNYQLYMQILNSASNPQHGMGQDGSQLGSEISMLSPSPSGAPPSPFTPYKDIFPPNFDSSSSQPPSPMMFSPSGSSSMPQMPFGVPFSPGMFPQQLPFTPQPQLLETRASQWDHMEDNKDYEPWEWWLKNSAINRYMSNAKYLKELFCEPNAEQQNIKPAASNEKRKQALNKQLKKINKEIEELEKENNHTLEQKETERQKFIEYFAKLSECADRDELLQVKTDFERDFGPQEDDDRIYSGNTTDRTALGKRHREAMDEQKPNGSSSTSPRSTSTSPPSSPSTKRQRLTDEEEHEDQVSSTEHDSSVDEEHTLHIRRVTDTIDKTELSRLKEPSLLNL